MTSHDIQHLHAFTLEQALDLIPTISEDQMTDTRVYLLVGTNNIKRGETARECADKHKEITDMIVEKAQHVTVIQLPHIYSRDQRKQREIERQIIKLNTILEERHPNNIISTQFMELNRKLIDQDGIHLTTQAARDLATAIIQTSHTKETTQTDIQRTVTNQEQGLRITIQQNQPEQQEDEIEVVKTNNRGAPIVIGSKGLQVRILKAKYNVQIDTEKMEGGEYVLIIRGQPEDTKTARKEINRIINGETQTSQPDKRPQTHTNSRKFNTTCRYYKMDRCNRGDQCQFRHRRPRRYFPNDTRENHHRKMEPEQQRGMGELQQRNEHQRGGTQKQGIPRP